MVGFTTVLGPNLLNTPLARYAKAIEDQSEADRLWYMRLERMISEYR